ncbi:nucleic acid/nucleotide deaminase domain-containing protein [Streptomyces sp. NPDC002932]|uniref:nucleic acid/nucleotide deaminase domain-containing protein n=1 Tax=Streptomyces sp. NPDC002932 TaxID=3364672 RepID=UPI0036905128
MDGARAKHVITDATGPGRLHPEEIIWERLSAEGVAPAQALRVYCELEPCLMPGHYCAAWMQETFPHAHFSHSFDYGDTADSRKAGLKLAKYFASENPGLKVRNAVDYDQLGGKKDEGNAQQNDYIQKLKKSHGR